MDLKPSDVQRTPASVDAILNDWMLLAASAAGASRAVLLRMQDNALKPVLESAPPRHGVDDTMPLCSRAIERRAVEWALERASGQPSAKNGQVGHAAVPLYGRSGRPLGALALRCLTPGSRTEEKEAALTALGRRLAAALESIDASAAAPAVALESRDPAASRQATSLTQRQRQVLCLIAAGKRTRDIANELGLKEKTVETHRSELMNRLGIREVAGLTRFAIRAGMVEL